MAIIRIKRSTGTVGPSSLAVGEIAVTLVQATEGAFGNEAGRLFVGNAAGIAITVGGEYFTSLLGHQPSIIYDNKAVIVGNAGTITDWNVVGFTTLNDVGITSNLTVGGASTFTGNVKFNDLSLVTITSDITVSGASTFIERSQFNSDLTVGGASTFTERVGFNTDITVGGASTFTGTAEFNDASIVTLSATTGVINTLTGISLGYENVNFTGIVTTNRLNINEDLFVSGLSTLSSRVNIGGTVFVGAGFTEFTITDTGELTAQQITNYGFTPDSLTYVDAAYTLRSPVGLAYSEGDQRLELFDGVIGVNTLHADSGVVTTLDGTTVRYSTGIITTLTVGAAGTQYQLPAGAGTTGQILKMNPDGTTSSFATLDTRLNFQTDDLAGTVGLGSEVWDILGTPNQIKTDAPGIGRTLTIALTDDVTVGGALTVSGAVSIGGSLTVQGNMTYLDSTITQIQDKKIEIAYSDSPSDASADGGGISVKGSADYEIVWSNALGAFTSNQNWFPYSSDAYDPGSESVQWRNLYVSRTSELTNVTIAGVGTTQTAEISAGTIDNTTIGAAGTATGDFSDITFNDATSGGTITIPRVDTTDLNVRDIEATGVATVATFRIDIGPAVNAVAYAGTGGFVGYTSAPSAGITSSRYLLTSVGIGASNIPVWTDTIDCGFY